jgi:hypothetical protein
VIAIRWPADGTYDRCPPFRCFVAEILDGYIVERNGERRGLLLLKYHSPTSAEIYWMGVDPTCHRKGRALVKAPIDDAS